MKRNLLYILGVVCLMTSCVEENFENHGLSSMAGKEVVFSADMNDGPVTRTNYGGPVTNNGITTAFKVNWADNDSVLVYCIDSKTSGKYEVVPGVDENGEYSNYAESLIKDGEHGVQWSDSETSTFVAVYPAKNSSVSKDGVITTNISSVQNNVFEPIYGTDGTTVTGWKGKAFDNDANSPTMTNGIMFARTVASPKVTDENGNQTTTTNIVNLRFKPYSTVLKFEFVGYEPNIETIQTVYVQSITLTAPQPIAGEFNLSVTGNGDDAVVDGCNTNSTTKTITLNTMLPGGSFIPLKKNQTLEFNVFTIPSGNHTLSGEWKVTLKTDNGDYTYSLIPTTGTNTLAAGQINKIKVPKLEIKTSKTLDPTKWISELPKPVYLSELSVPGAWYCMDKGYQTSGIGLGSDELTYISQKSTAADGTITSYYITSTAANGIDDGLENLYFNGVRAFNIDCRITKNDCGDFGFANAEKKWSDDDYNKGNFHFACSGTESVDTYVNIGYQIHEGKYVLEAMKELVTLAKAHKDEYIVVIFTFAEKPLTEKQIVNAAHGSVNALWISEQLNKVLTDNSIAPYLYTDITPNTTIEDVISSGKNVIVKINHSNADFATSTNPLFAMPAGIMASFASMAMSGYIQNNVTDITQAEYASYYKTMQSYPIYNGKTANNMTYYYHQAQKTESSTTASGSTYPSVYDRLAAVDSVLVYATKIYDNSSHNALFQIGIGGSVDDSPSTLAKTINPEVQKLIEEKLENDPSPLGFVLMNEALNTDYGLPLVKDIINMNTKFYLKRKGGDIITGNGGDNEGGTEEGEGEEL